MVGTCNYGDVTYYEQLGVARNASPEAIRHAYRSLVRLLHPDQQTDPDLKAAAERQLRKLNRIHSVLIDPEQRRAYDRFLADETAGEAIAEDEPNLRLRKNLIRSGWVVGVVLTVVLLFWIGSESTPVDVTVPLPNFTLNKPAAKKEASAVNPATNAEDVEALRRQLALAISERDDARKEVEQLRSKRSAFPSSSAARAALPAGTAGEPPVTAPAASSATTAASSGASGLSGSATQPAAPQPVEAKPQPAKPQPAKTRSLAGAWFYVHPRQGQHNKDRSLYPPEFIELTITVENGNLKGRYRARYRISDRPISPDVNFEISGKDTGGLCACSWRGIGGARGQINLQLMGENTMRFDWSAAELGNQQGLASGTAVLARRADAP